MKSSMGVGATAGLIAVVEGLLLYRCSICSGQHEVTGFVECSFHPGRQEDAHEFLVGLLDAMHESILWGLKPKPPKEVAETSLIYRIFAGTMRSQVRCMQNSPSGLVFPSAEEFAEYCQSCKLEHVPQSMTCRQDVSVHVSAVCLLLGMWVIAV